MKLYEYIPSFEEDSIRRPLNLEGLHKLMANCIRGPDDFGEPARLVSTGSSDRGGSQLILR